MWIERLSDIQGVSGAESCRTVRTPASGQRRHLQRRLSTAVGSVRDGGRSPPGRRGRTALNRQMPSSGMSAGLSPARLLWTFWRGTQRTQEGTDELDVNTKCFCVATTTTFSSLLFIYRKLTTEERKERQSLVMPSCMRGHDLLLHVPSHARVRAAKDELWTR
jgi:hypothetical protein